MSMGRAMPHRTAANRRRAIPCPKCGAAPQERCRRWVGHPGSGFWQYLALFHRERKA